MIDRPLREALGLPDGATIDWFSPAVHDQYREYRDGAALDLLGVRLDRRRLSDFWPARGPVWDGLARTSTGEVILVEAKAHIPELLATGTKAEGASLERIKAALDEVQRAIASKSYLDWSGPFYQYANRLAFLYLLRVENNVNAHLVHVMFLNAAEMQGPAEASEWRGALALLRSTLGLQSHTLNPFTHEVYIDIDDLARQGAIEPRITAISQG